MEKRIVVQSTPKDPSRLLPKVIKWKGINMVRNQSFLACIKDIINYSEEMDVTRIGILGDMHSGKSTLAMSIAHAIHSYAKTKFAVRVFWRDDLRNFKKTIEALPPANYVLVFDDVSFMKDTAQIEQEITEIRHMEGGHDVKIVLIFNFHYPKALPPFLREFQYKFVTSIGTDNEKTIADNYGKDNVNLIKDFKFQRKQAITKKVWFERIGPKEPIKYDFRNPFIPCLFWNEQSIRKIVTPTRYFIDKQCTICDQGEGNKIYDDKTLAEIMEEGKKAYGKSFITAIKLLLFIEGHDTFNSQIRYAVKWLSREQKERNLPLSAIATYFDLQEVPNRLRKKKFDEIKKEQEQEVTL